MISPPILKFQERYRFHNRQAQEESAAKYLSKLQQLGITCKFNDDAADPLSARLCNQFIWGMQDVKMQTYLLRQPDLNIDKSLHYAQQYEMTAKAASEIRHHAINEPHVDFVKGRRMSLQGKKAACFRCGLENHLAPNCRFKNVQCRICKKMGHLAKVCKCLASDTQPDQIGSNTNKDRQGRKAQYAVGAVAASETSQDEELGLFYSIEEIGMVKEMHKFPHQHILLPLMLTGVG